MTNKSKSIIAVLFALLLLVVPGIGYAEQPEAERAVGEKIPTRTIVKESENNDNWGNANLISNQTSNFELHGNSSDYRDLDFFYIHLDGGDGNNVHQLTIDLEYINTSSSSDYLFVLLYAFYPDNDLSHPSSDERLLHLRAYYENMFYKQPASLVASYTGIYGIGLMPQNASTLGALAGPIEYNLSVSIDRVSSPDSNNEEDSPQSVSSGTISGNLDQNEDLFDWFQFYAPNPIHPTVLDLTLSLSNTYPQYTSGTVHYGVEINLYVRYNTRSNPNSYRTDLYKISPLIRFQDTGMESVPFDLELEKNCTHMILGLTMRTYGLNSRNQKSYNTYDGETDYTMDLGISANIPNNRPILYNATLEPKRGTSDTIFQYSVMYRDRNNETPAYISLWIDGEEAKQLTRLPDQPEDLSVGARYGVKMSGESIGPNAAHTYNFSASDGEDIALTRPGGLGPFTGPWIDDNLPPSSTVGSIYRVDMREDRTTYYLELDDLFTDPNPDTVFEYWIVNETGAKNSEYREEGKLSAVLSNGTYSKPNHVLVVDLEEDVYGKFTLTINASDRGVNEEGLFQKFAEVDLLLNVEPVNDNPVITRINSVDVEDWGIPEVDQGEKYEVTVDVMDDDGDENLVFDWDLGDVLSDPEKGENFDFDIETGEMWFIPGDGDVPEMTTILTVEDSNGTEDSLELRFWIENVNDPPTIDVPDRRSTIQGEKIFVNPTYGDPDLDSGDFILFSFDLGDLFSYTESSNIEFNPNTGAFSLLADSEKMIGEWEVTFSVSDKKGERASDTCIFTIENVNDRPEANIINANIVPEDLDVRLFTDPAEDEDIGETLTYIWNFGDGSNEVSGVDLTVVNHTYPNAGAYSVTLRVTDGELMSDVQTKVIQVTSPPPDPDFDDDGIRDEWEESFGLDPNDPDDAEADPDGDGLTNYEEFRYGEENGVRLNPMNPDTDGDGYTDGEEVRKGYDPIQPASHPEKEYEMFGNVMLVFGILFMVLTFAILIIFVLVKIRNRKKPVAAPSAAAPVDEYQLSQQAPEQQLPPAPDVGGQNLPEAGSGEQEEYVQGGALPPVQPEGYQEPQGSDGDQIYQDTGYEGPYSPPEDGLYQDQQQTGGYSEQQEDLYGQFGYGDMDQPPDQQEPPSEGEVEDQEISEREESVEEEEETESKSSGDLPPPPPPPQF